MNPQSNLPSEYDGGPPPSPPALMAETRPMYWSVRRELWENRSIYIAPLVVAAVVLFGTLMSTIGLPHRMRSLPTLDPAKQHRAVAMPFSMAPAPIMLVTFLVGMFYSLDALYGERRDRSILFWKSLPVSDRTTVLSKAGIPLVLLPLIAFLLSAVTQVILLFASTAVLLGSHLSPARFWAEVRFFEGLPIMVYGLTVHALWFAPIYAWLLLVSAWARRTPLLWAVLPLFAIAVLERLAFQTTHFVSLLKYRFSGAMAEGFVTPGAGGDIERIWQLTPGRYLSSPGLWLGLVFAAVCLTAAVRLRRNREPI